MESPCQCLDLSSSLWGNETIHFYCFNYTTQFAELCLSSPDKHIFVNCSLYLWHAIMLPHTEWSTGLRYKGLSSSSGPADIVAE